MKMLSLNSESYLLKFLNYQSPKHLLSKSVSLQSKTNWALQGQEKISAIYSVNRKNL